jgi:hypothetical protein
VTEKTKRCDQQLSLPFLPWAQEDVGALWMNVMFS